MEEELRIFKNKYEGLKDKISILFESKVSSPLTNSCQTPEEDEKENDSEEEKENLNVLSNGISLRKASSIKEDVSNLPLDLFIDSLEELENSESAISYNGQFVNMGDYEKVGKSSSDYNLPLLSAKGSSLMRTSNKVPNLQALEKCRFTINVN